MMIPEFPPFDPDKDPATTPQRWGQYLRKVDNALTAWGITDDDRKHAFLIHYGGDKIETIEQTLTYTKAKDVKFKNLSEALTAYFEPKRNITFATYQFAQMKQEESEMIDGFVTRLRTQAALCDFDNSERRIKDQIVFGCRSKKVRHKALHEDMTLEKLIKEARCEEAATQQAEVIEKGQAQESSEAETFRVSRQPG